MIIKMPRIVEPATWRLCYLLLLLDQCIQPLRDVSQRHSAALLGSAMEALGATWGPPWGGPWGTIWGGIDPQGGPRIPHSYCPPI